MTLGVQLTISTVGWSLLGTKFGVLRVNDKITVLERLHPYT